MKILITGHKGFIGKNLKNYFKNKINLEFYNWKENTFPNLHNVKAVIHMGAISSTTEKNVKKIMKQNYDFTTKLIDLCIKKKIQLIYASSASVYGNTKNFKETSQLFPNSNYSWSKYLIDRYLEKKLLKKLSFKIQGLRFFNVYGNFESHKKEQKSVFHKFIFQSKKYKKIYTFKGSSKFKRDFIFVEDVCKIIEKFLSVKESGIWNVGTGIATSFEDIAKYIGKKTQSKIVHIPMPINLKNHYQVYTKSNNKKLINSLGKIDFIKPYDWIDIKLKS